MADRSAPPAALRSGTSTSSSRRRTLAAVVTTMTSAALLSTWKGTAEAAPPRPNGEAEIIATFGAHCNAAANDHTTMWANGAWDGGGGESRLEGHSALANEWNLARWWVANTEGGDDKVNYGVGGYFCRPKSGDPDQWSVHAWGIAVDTNTACNPQGGDTWNGVGYGGGGCGGHDYGTALPDIWKANNDMLRLNFAWGLSWSDPHHFQYATGY